MSYIKINGIKTYYEESGSGIPIVFLHGWSLNLGYWQPQVEYFSQRYRTIAYDWRGMGMSNGGNRHYKFTDLSDDLAAFLKTLNIERPILCGHSQGANIALQYAIATVAPISALVFADAPGPHNTVTSPCTLALFRTGVAVRSLFPGKVLRPFVPLFRDLFYSEDFRSSNPEAIKAWQKQFLSNSARAVLHADAAQAYWKGPTAKLHRITAPTLLLRGSEDKLVPMRETRAYHKKISGSQLELIEGAGHMTLQEQPKVFNQLMDKFLNSVLPHPA